MADVLSAPRTLKPLPQAQAPATAPVVKSVVLVETPTPAARAPGFTKRNRAVLVFVFLLFLADYGVGLLAPLWEQYSPDDYRARIKGCSEQPRDVVFIGASPVGEGIDPTLIAGVMWRGRPLANVYAVGLSGGTTTDFYFATLRACPTPPRMLVYGITASDLNDSRGEPHAVHSLFNRDDVLEVVQTRPDASEWIIRHYIEAQFGKASSIYRYRHAMRMWAATQADQLMPGSCPETKKEADELREHADNLARGTGYAPHRGYSRVRYDHLKLFGQPPSPFNYLDRYRTGSHLKYLHKLIDWCEDRGVELILVDMPVTADLEAKFPEAFSEYRARLAEVERTRKLRVIRAVCEQTWLTDEHFADLIHLTPRGCVRFSTWLRARLEELK
ncbi:MAG: hypothetical protein L0241_11890 [Planctomycetia bacterium]|nr:hypothetical protein [Planctomycetia bacterium]